LRDSLPIDMLLSAVSVLVVAQSSSEVPEGLMNNPVSLVLKFGNSLFCQQCIYAFCVDLRTSSHYFSLYH